MDESLAEDYRKATGGVLPKKVKFVPQMRFDSESIDSWKEEQAAERAA